MMGDVILMSKVKKRGMKIQSNQPIDLKPKMFYDLLPNNSWKGHRCFIVGGGVSLQGFDYSALDDELSIGVNRAFEKFDPTILFFADARFWGWLEQGVFGQWAAEKFKKHKIKVALNHNNIFYPDNILRIEECRNALSWDLNTGIMLGDNSGFAALNMALCLGANPIYLLGFDMKKTNGQTNWHEGYPKDTPGSVFDVYTRHFERNAALIKEKGFRVVNLNPKSKLKCFEFGNTSDIFKGEKQPLYMEGYAGIGDNFWQRPFIKEICKNRTLYLLTFTPQVYWDIPNLKFIKPPYPAFSSHNKIANGLSRDTWTNLPRNIKEVKKPLYWLGFKYGLSLSDQFEALFKVNEYDFSFQVKESWVSKAEKILKRLYTKGKKICIIRFPVTRKEWQCPAREPKPEYLQMLIDRYKDEYYFISLAEMSSNNEYFLEEPKNIDKAFHNGKLSLEEIFGLIKLADMVITGNCFLLPASLAIGTKTFGVFGGCQHPELFLDKRMDLRNFSYVLPEPFCNCNNPRHDCNKDIPEEKIIDVFEGLKKKEKSKIQRFSKKIERTEIEGKENLLIYKVGRMYHQSLLNNTYLQEKYNLIFEMIVDDVEKYLIANKIKAMISVDFPPENTKNICKRLNINWLFCEAFLGRGGVFDKIGAHFTPQNEIKEFVEKISIVKNPNVPNWTKVEQPKIISRREMFNKYGLNNRKKYIVVLGQEIDDKSLIYSKNRSIKNYRDYIDLIVMNNLDVKFLFKPHPVYKTIKAHKAGCMDFVHNYRNIIMIDENIQSLFSLFEHFTAFSSTTIFEGLIKNRKFATMGYHFCDDDRVVLQLKDNEDAKNLYQRMSEFNIEQEMRAKYIYFISNYYSIQLQEKQLLDRLELTSDEYFKGRY